MAFPTGGAVPPRELVGRSEVVEEVARRLRQGHNVFIAGPRTTGKSSLAAAVAARLAAQGPAVVAAEFRYTATLAACVRNLFDACAAAASGTRGAWPQVLAARRDPELLRGLRLKLGPFADVGVALARAARPEEGLDLALSLPARLAERLRTRVVVVLDEIQDAGKLHAGFYRSLARYMSGGWGVSHLFVGSPASAVRALFTQPGEPLRGTALEVDAPAAASAEWREHLAGRLADAGLEPAQPALDALIERTGAHPRDTMLVAQALLEGAAGRRRRTLRAADVEAAGDRVLRALGPAFEAEWSELSRDRGARIAVPRIVRGDPVHHDLPHADSKAASAALQRLVRDGDLRRVRRGRYELCEPLFAEWLRERVAV